MEENIYINGNAHIKECHMLVDVPEYCPMCEHNMCPIILSNAIISDVPIIKKSAISSDIYQVSFIARCTKCRHLYTNIFEVYPDNQYRPQILKDVYFEIRMPTVNVELPEIINSVSPKFVKIYTQALQAEKLNLDELAGMGLRKAIEFLIKDYAIKNNPKSKEDIKKYFLSKVINDFIEDNTLKKLAEGAVWIANDETHYVKEWPNKDINDIKQYIKCFINYIELKSNIADIEDMRQQRNEKKK
nr:hypothetical protein [uncultured Ligilactobacillus sp.]